MTAVLLPALLGLLLLAACLDPYVPPQAGPPGRHHGPPTSYLIPPTWKDRA